MKLMNLEEDFATYEEQIEMGQNAKKSQNPIQK